MLIYLQFELFGGGILETNMGTSLDAAGTFSQQAAHDGAVGAFEDANAKFLVAGESFRRLLGSFLNGKRMHSNANDKSAAV